MRPYKTFLLLLVLLLLLYGPAFFMSGPLKIAKGISLKWPDEVYNYFSGDNRSTDSLLLSERKDTAISVILPDTTSVHKRSRFFYDFSGPALLQDSLFNLLHNYSTQVRVMYYGDSQLEGDRITDRLRERLRLSAGGTGPGMLSITSLVPYTRTTKIRTSDNWLSYNYLSTGESGPGHRNLGPMMSISRFTDPDSGSNEITKAWFSVESSRFADSLSSVYERFRLFYGGLTDSLVIIINTDRGSLKRDILYPSEEEREYSVELGSAGYIKVQFEGTGSPDFYCFSLESDDGLVVDNISNRGSAGLEFTMVSSSNLKKLYSMLDPDVIILHYGLNVVLNIRSDYDYYENGIYRQLTRLQELCPQAVIILAGLTDMAHKDAGELASYDNIPAIRDAQKKAAARAGVMFWDTFEAMGGRNSIVEWAGKDPSLAADDYTHVTYAGGHEIADMLINDILLSGTDEGETNSNDTLILNGSYTGKEDISPSDHRTFSPEKIREELFSFDVNKPLLFTGPVFWFFLFVLLLFYSIIYKKPLIRNTYLFLFSLFFYYKSGGVFFILLIVSTITDYIAGLAIHASQRKAMKKLFVIISLIVNLGMLSYFKYTSFFTTIVNGLFNTDFPDIDWLAALSNFYLGTGFNTGSIVLPVGISFFTFQTISYTLDVYRGKTGPVRNILDFGFYVSFFPQLVAGPIVRASEFVPQLYSSFRLTKREWGHALFLILSGLIKKIIISDVISVNYVDRVFDTPLLYSGFENLMAIYGYGLQIYCDFSGYTDIAIGIALMLGYRLPVNFNSPYKAHNITDFWRRWHISLSRWLKDYLYISLGGNRKGSFRTYTNLMITMVLGGLWHGAAWRFVLWGGLHGLGLVINKLWMRIFPRRNAPTGRLKRFTSVLLTFNFVSFCWIFFRAPDLGYVQVMLGRIFTSFSPGSISGLITAYGQVFMLIILGYIIHFLPVKIKESYRGLFIRTPLILKIIMVYIIALVLYNVQSADLQPFIYFRF